MTPYFQDESVTLLHSDVLEALRAMPSNSFDGCFCDPPYGLSQGDNRSPQRKSGVEQNKRGFMGLEWDGQVPGPAVWKEVRRVMVPGSFLLAFGGTRTHHRLMCAIEDGGFEIRDCLMWLYGSGFPKSLNLGDGRGTALKPAWEPIILGMKPCEGTYVDNALKWGVAGLDIDGSRVGYEDTADPATNPLYRVQNGYKTHVGSDSGGSSYSIKPDGGNVTANPLGRWPANVIHDGSDEVLDCFPDAPGQLADVSLNSDSRKTQNCYGPMKRGNEASANRRYTENGSTNFAALPGARRNDSGSAARFFYCAKASSSERNGNTHPTVKPIKLTEYLAKLILPPKRDAPCQLIVPFSGSGSEMIGALTAGWDEVTGIEREEQYLKTAAERISVRRLSQSVLAF